MKKYKKLVETVAKETLDSYPSRDYRDLIKDLCFFSHSSEYLKFMIRINKILWKRIL